MRQRSEENAAAGAGDNQRFVDVIGRPLLEKPKEIRAGVTAVVFDDRGRVLLEHRADNGWWGLPGGAVDIGESVSEAVIREVKEETGLTVRITRLVGLYTDPTRYAVTQYPDGNVVQYVSIAFECEYLEGELRISVESTELGYFGIDELPPDTLPGHRVRVEDALVGPREPHLR